MRDALDRGMFKLKPGISSRGITSNCTSRGGKANKDTTHVEVNYSAVLDTAIDIAKGMCHLHSLNIIHGDLKVRGFVREDGVFWGILNLQSSFYTHPPHNACTPRPKMSC